MTRAASVEQADPAFFEEASSIHKARQQAYADLHEINARGMGENGGDGYRAVLDAFDACSRREESLRAKYYPSRHRLLCREEPLLCSRTARSMQIVVPPRPVSVGFDPLTSWSSTTANHGRITGL